LAKCHLREGRELREVEEYLREYLELEDSTATIAELESYLKGLSLISAGLDDDLDDLGLLAFQILLYFKQNRYMDIVKVGDTLQKGYIFVPEYEKEEYVEVLRLIGDSYYRINYLYDATDFFKKALEVDPESLEILWRLALVYERLSNDHELQKINVKIEDILSQKETDFENFLINRGESFSQRVMFEGKKIILNLHLKSMEEEATPWVSVFLNGVVVWEDYTMTEMLSIPLEPNAGENTVRVVSGNTSINLIDIEYKDEE
jgi:tetratricopeptide (TPR) repeat protein